jgi:Zn-dependent M16 (insulinase) family peptidase
MASSGRIHSSPHHVNDRRLLLHVVQALSSLVSSSYLHPEIREKGGAYGSGAMSGEGLWSFYSFRDPNTTRYMLFARLRPLSRVLTSRSGVVF